MPFLVLDPAEKYSTNDSYHLTGFWPEQFKEIIRETTLMPDRIMHAGTRVTASNEMDYFILLRRWRKADTWDDARKTVCRRRCFCDNTYYALFYELKHNYERCVLVVDFRRLTPQLLENWNETLEAHAGVERDEVFL